MTVLAHAAPRLSATSLNLNASGAGTIFNDPGASGAGLTAGLDLLSISSASPDAAAFQHNLVPFTNLPASATTGHDFLFQFAAGTKLGQYTASYTLTVGDDQSLSGANVPTALPSPLSVSGTVTGSSTWNNSAGGNT